MGGRAVTDSTQLDDGLTIDVIDIPESKFIIRLCLLRLANSFHGEDELEDIDRSLDDYLRNDRRKTLKTKDPKKKVGQMNELLMLVTLVLEKNDGVPYTNELFMELKALKVNSLIGDSKHV
ncbi:GTPase IMAP member 4, partial [Datura stramonium]|nr:GTPase IMAP member 4 [Datura stramonium]